MLLACLSGAALQVQRALAARRCPWTGLACKATFLSLPPAADVVRTDRALQRLGEVVVVMSRSMVMMGCSGDTGELMVGRPASYSSAADVMVVVTTRTSGSMVAMMLRWRRGTGGLVERLLQNLKLQVLLAPPAGPQHAALSGDGVDPGRLQGALHTLLLVLLC